MSSTTNSVSMLMPMQTQSIAAANVSSVTDLKQSGLKASASFGSVLNQVSDTVIQTKSADSGKDINKHPADAKSSAAKPLTGNADTGKAKESNTADDKEAGKISQAEIGTNGTEKPINADAKETDTVKADEKLQKAVDEAGRELIENIAEAFDLSEEDVINAMQTLGLMAADLLNPANLQEVVTNIIGQDRALELITDSELYTSLQDLLEGAEDMRSQLKNEYDLSDEELQAVIDELPKDFSRLIDKNAEMAPQIIVNEAGEELTRDSAAPQSDKTSEVNADAISGKTHIEIEKPVEEANEKSDSGHESGENPHQDAGAANLFNQLTQNIAEAVNDTQSAAAEYTDRAQMESIVRQITEKITISAGTDETSMELQLHPASLGNVNILLTSGKDGIVARFTAQNEIVKEAVESQMMQLQQKFDEQGIKVTSIEVTIASHAFEQSLDDQDQRQGYEEPGKGKKGPRRINLSQISDIDEAEELDDTERLAAQMMAANGNTVDFSA